MFTKQALSRLIPPLIIEQLLALTIGIVNTIMVSGYGETAVSGVSLVDSINVLMITIFVALATGGAIVVAQCLGSGDIKKSNEAARQLVIVVGTLSLCVSIVALIFRNAILLLVFGDIERAVMGQAQIYFFWTALSYLPMGLYNVGAALFRVVGNSKISMLVSFLMNLINLVGNIYLIRGLNWGVRGAAVPALLARMVGAVVVLWLLAHNNGLIRITSLRGFRFHPGLVKSILKVGIPNGIENGMFHFGKLLVQGVVAQFGTATIAANAVANSLVGITQIPSSAIGIAMITVVGQCVGAREYQQAKSHCIKLTMLSYVSVASLSGMLFVFARLLLGLYGISPQSQDLATQLLTIFCIGSTLFWPAAFTLPNGLRAAGDVRFTMTISILSMWCCRVGLSYVFAQMLGMGLQGVWLAMIVDWICRDLFFIPRLLQQKWMKKSIV